MSAFFNLCSCILVLFVLLNFSSSSVNLCPTDFNLLLYICLGPVHLPSHDCSSVRFWCHQTFQTFFFLLSRSFYISLYSPYPVSYTHLLFNIVFTFVLIGLTNLDAITFVWCCSSYLLDPIDEGLTGGHIYF